MFNDYVHAALARERVSDLQAKAQAARRARLTRTRRQPETPSVPRPRPAMEGTPTTLRDGSTVLIRQVRGTDAHECAVRATEVGEKQPSAVPGEATMEA